MAPAVLRRRRPWRLPPQQWPTSSCPWTLALLLIRRLALRVPPRMPHTFCLHMVHGVAAEGVTAQPPLRAVRRNLLGRSNRPRSIPSGHSLPVSLPAIDPRQPPEGQRPELLPHVPPTVVSLPRPVRLGSGLDRLPVIMPLPPRPPWPRLLPPRRLSSPPRCLFLLRLLRRCSRHSRPPCPFLPSIGLIYKPF